MTTPGSRTTPGARVLVIDDSPTILKLVQLVLTRAKYQVHTASSGEAALKAAKEDRPDLILLDYFLPDLNGYDLCAAMSADTVLCKVPVIIMSARGDEIENKFGGAENVVDFISKPFSPDVLLAALGHRLDGSATRSAPLSLTPASTPPLGHEAVQPAETHRADAIAIPIAAVLSGDLAAIPISDVLTMLADQGQTGVLTLAHGKTRLETSFKNGRIAFATAVGVAEEFLLGRFLVEAQLVTQNALATVIAERTNTGSAPRRLLGADLIARSLCTTAGLRKAMGHQTAALVYEGLRWDSGRFWFSACDELSDQAEEASANLAIDGLLMEAFRRVDEWRLIEREIRDFDLVFIRNDGKLAAFGRGALSRQEQLVLEFINGKNSVKDIIYLSSMGSFEVTKMLYRLLRTKLIRRRVGAMAV